MTHRGPFQPLLFCDSVIHMFLKGLRINRVSSAVKTLGKQAFYFLFHKDV